MDSRKLLPIVVSVILAISGLATGSSHEFGTAHFSPVDDGSFENGDAEVGAEEDGDGDSGQQSPSDDGAEDGNDSSPCGEVTAAGVCLRDPNREPDTPPLSMADLIAFRPAVPAQGMQPNGWAVAGLPANFVSEVESETQSGVLLGLPVTIRFTPVAWEWDYGDGTSREADHGGASWSELRVPEFSDTATSHIYTQRGEYTVTLTLRFAAEYQFAGRPWRTIPGTLPVPANPLTIIAAKAKTVLVEEDCNQNPSGPGC